jgi:hypothetical protein
MLPNFLIPNLESAADAAINNVLRTGAVAVNQRVPTGEVGFVAAFVLGAVPDIAKAWRQIIRPHGYSIQMTGVFCHQTPMATFTDTSGIARTCELADLLVVVDDLTSGAATTRWAVLVQAKMVKAGGGQTLTQQGDLTQLDLLSNWPTFTLPSGFAPGSRDFSTCRHAGSPIECGRYGLIDGQPNPLWHQRAPASSMPAGGDQLGTFIARMLEGRHGYGREATGTADDWSRTVDELLKVTAGLAFTYATGLKGSHPRGNSVVALVSAPDTPMFVAAQWRSGPPPTGGRPEERPDGPGEGINLIHIGLTRARD